MIRSSGIAHCAHLVGALGMRCYGKPSRSRGVFNNVGVIPVLVLSNRRGDLVQRYRWLHLGLTIPTVYGLVLAQQERCPAQSMIFLATSRRSWPSRPDDQVLKEQFREPMDWPLLVPYVALQVILESRVRRHDVVGLLRGCRGPAAGPDRCPVPRHATTR